MQFKIVHILDSLDRINFGIWNAAIFTAKYLKEKHDIHSIVVVTQKQRDIPADIQLPIFFITQVSKKEVSSFCDSQFLSTRNTVIVTHGCWLQPTQIGYAFKQLGFRWMYTPQGMLEPWSLSQKRFKKQLYFLLFEKRWSSHADCIRAVSESELKHLRQRYHQPIQLIENGVVVPDYIPKPKGGEIWLFMARLHHKKGVLPLIKAWANTFKNIGDKKLIIAGPDEGELEKIKPYIDGGNIEYVGPVYGLAKVELLKVSHYYVLPSFSEGFPTSVVEAMSYGLIPIISSGCNFPDVFREKLGYHIEPEEKKIERVLNKIKDIPFDQNLSLKNWTFIKHHNSDSYLGGQLYHLYRKLLINS